MAGKKSLKTKSKISREVKEQPQQASSYFKISESYTSLVLGIVVVIIAAALLVAFFRGRNNIKTPPPAPEISSTKIGPEDKSDQDSGQNVVVSSGKEYVVGQGDDLWNIAVKVYNDGYRWTEIAKANNISNPGIIFVGTKLVIPSLMSSKTDMNIDAANSKDKGVVLDPISSETYSIKEGDTLWDIAVRKYNNGYRWVDIAKQNNINNPDIIFVNTSLNLPK